VTAAIIKVGQSSNAFHHRDGDLCNDKSLRSEASKPPSAKLADLRPTKDVTATLPLVAVRGNGALLSL
jgi:hypothetical protein